MTECLINIITTNMTTRHNNMLLRFIASVSRVENSDEEEEGKDLDLSKRALSMIVTGGLDESTRLIRVLRREPI